MFEKIKYTGDDPYVYGLNDQEFLPDTSETVRKDLLSNSLRVTEEMFPEIYQMINEVLYKLEIDSNVETFISSDPNPQALCIAQLNSVDFIIIITSSLLEILSPSELSFVIGQKLATMFLNTINTLDPVIMRVRLKDLINCNSVVLRK